MDATFHGFPIVAEYVGSCVLKDGKEIPMGYVLVDFGVTTRESR